MGQLEDVEQNYNRNLGGRNWEQCWSLHRVPYTYIGSSDTKVKILMLLKWIGGVTIAFKTTACFRYAIINPGPHPFNNPNTEVFCPPDIPCPPFQHPSCGIHMLGLNIWSSCILIVVLFILLHAGRVYWMKSNRFCYWKTCVKDNILMLQETADPTLSCCVCPLLKLSSECQWTAAVTFRNGLQVHCCWLWRQCGQKRVAVRSMFVFLLINPKMMCVLCWSTFPWTLASSFIEE